MFSYLLLCVYNTVVLSLVWISRGYHRCCCMDQKVEYAVIGDGHVCAPSLVWWTNAAARPHRISHIRHRTPRRTAPHAMSHPRRIQRRTNRTQRRIRAAPTPHHTPHPRRISASRASSAASTHGFAFTLLQHSYCCSIWW